MPKRGKDMSKKIGSQIQTFLTKNVGLKLIAIVSASLLWLLVVNLDDPTQSRNFTATVTVENEDVLTDAGKYYILPNGNTVTFRVTARRSIIESLSGSDFTVTADMNDLEDDRQVPVEITANRYANQISISSKTHYLTVAVGFNADTTFKIQSIVTGNPADGFEAGDVTVSPEVISVEGPSDIVSTIDSVSVTVDVGGAVEDITTSAVPKLYNTEGQEIEAGALTLSAESVQVNVDILSVQEVKIAVETSGKLKNGLELDAITTDPGTIRLKGDAETLNSLTTVTVPSDVIDLSDITEDFETTIDISSYLPDGVTVAAGGSTQVKIMVSVISEDSEEFKVKTSNLTIRNLGAGLVGKFIKKSVTVSIHGLESDLADLDAGTITGSVDASGLSEGTHTVTITLDLDDEFIAKTTTADIVISSLEKPEETKTTETTTTEETSTVPQEPLIEDADDTEAAESTGGSDETEAETDGSEQ